MIEELSSLQIRISAAQGYSAWESAETLTLFRHEAEKWLLREFMGQDPKWKNKIFADGKVTLIYRIDVWMVMSYAFSGEWTAWVAPPEEVCWHVGVNCRECENVINWEWQGIFVVLALRGGHSRGRWAGYHGRMIAMMRIPRTKTSVWTLRSERKCSYQWIREFWTYAMDVHGSVSDCYVWKALGDGLIELLCVLVEKT